MRAVPGRANRPAYGRAGDRLLVVALHVPTATATLRRQVGLRRLDVCVHSDDVRRTRVADRDPAEVELRADHDDSAVFTEFIVTAGATDGVHHHDLDTAALTTFT